jgi:GT2 family glycosyltransferase
MDRKKTDREPERDLRFRPFRLDGLEAERLDIASARSAESPAAPGESRDVLLWLDFAGRGAGSLAAFTERLVEALPRLRPQGVVLVALPNRFGLRFWSGCPEPGTGRLFSPLTELSETLDPGDGPPLLVSRRDLESALSRAGLVALEWFHPVVDAAEVEGAGAQPGSLLSERLIALAPEVAAELATARPAADPVRPRLDLFPEPLAARGLARAGLLADFADYFLVAAAASAHADVWTRLRPPVQQLAWHFAADRREPTETVFELDESGAVTVRKRRLEARPSPATHEFVWNGQAGEPLAAGGALRLRFLDHLMRGGSDAFADEFAAFFAFIQARYGRGGRLSGVALDALLTNATREPGGDHHLFDLEWSAREEIAPSWWILRNVLACLDMRGPAMGGVPTAAALYESLCARLGVGAQLAADLASEAAFAAAVRASRPELHAEAIAQALARPWPVPVVAGGDAAGLRDAVQLELVHRQLVADYRKLESWATELHEELERTRAERLELESEAKGLASAVSAAVPARAVAASRPAPSVRVVVVHHRNSELLDHSLRAVLASRGVTLDLVLFENDCHEALPEWIASEPRVHRLSSARALGFGEANNRAVAWSREHLPPVDAYFFLNNDAVVRPDTVERLASVLEEHPDAAATGPLILIWGAEDHLNSLGLNLSTIGEAWDEGIGVPVERHLPLPGRQEVLALTGSALLVRRTAFEAARGWSELFDFYMEDLDLCLKFRRLGQSVWLVPDAVVAHAVSATAGPESEFKLFLFWRNRWVLMLLHWPWREILRDLPVHWRNERNSYRARRLALDSKAADRQRRAWLGAAALLPRILAARLRHGGDVSWWQLLKPAGTAPAITLPDVVSRGRPWDSAIAGGTSR